MWCMTPSERGDGLWELSMYSSQSVPSGTRISTQSVLSSVIPPWNPSAFGETLWARSKVGRKLCLSERTSSGLTFGAGYAISSFIADIGRGRKAVRVVDQHLANQHRHDIEPLEAVIAEFKLATGIGLELHPSYTPGLRRADNLFVDYKLHQREAGVDRILSLLICETEYTRHASGRWS